VLRPSAAMQRCSDVGVELDLWHLGCLECCDVVSQRCLEPAVAHRGGMGEAPDLGGGVPQAHGQPFGVFLVGGAGGHAFAQCFGGQSGSGQQWGDAVVQVAAKLGAFLGDGLEDLSAG
jgi:hypothetical protein